MYHWSAVGAEMGVVGHPCAPLGAYHVWLSWYTLALSDVLRVTVPAKNCWPESTESVGRPIVAPSPATNS